MAVDRSSTQGRILAFSKRAFGVLHRGAYRMSGGRLGGKVNKLPVLLLTTTGRRTGQRRTVPLVYWERDGEYVVSASNAGHWLPAWYRNLQADDRVTVEVGRRRFAGRAHLADVEESRQLWAVSESKNPAFAKYRESLPHEIPMVVLRPSGEPAQPTG